MSTETDDLARLVADVLGSASAGPELDRSLWSTLANSGLTRLTGSEESGGSGATWGDAAVLLNAVGEAGAAIPVAENDLLGGWLLEHAGLGGSDGILTAAVVDAGSSARHVPWARDADSVVLLGARGVASAQRSDLEIVEAVNVAGEPRDHISVDPSALTWAPIAAGAAEEFLLRGALGRSLMMVGAMDRVLDLVIEHTTARVQFGRPVGKFQAVQHMVADIAAESALARAAAEAAVAKVVDAGFADNGFAIAAAKSCAGHAASLVVRNAHQCLGAIGFTQEHALHRSTNRLLAWRAEYGSVRHWDDVITRAAVDAGSAGLWGLISR